MKKVDYLIILSWNIKKEIIEQEKNFFKKVTEEIDFFGPANFQLILTKKGPMIFEINPRFSSTVLMRNHLGFTDLLWSFQEKFGLKLTENKIQIGRIISRYDEINFLN